MPPSLEAAAASLSWASTAAVDFHGKENEVKSGVPVALILGTFDHDLPSGCDTLLCCRRAVEGSCNGVNDRTERLLCGGWQGRTGCHHGFCLVPLWLVCVGGKSGDGSMGVTLAGRAADSGGGKGVAWWGAVAGADGKV
jgi:hypothetical protein